MGFCYGTVGSVYAFNYVHIFLYLDFNDINIKVASIKSVLGEVTPDLFFGGYANMFVQPYGTPIYPATSWSSRQKNVQISNNWRVKDSKNFLNFITESGEPITYDLDHIRIKEIGLGDFILF
jgi:hypothetical protein